MSWVSILELSIGIIGGIGLLIYAWKEGYLDWEEIKYYISEAISLDGLKQTVLTIFSKPKFIFLYLILVLAPVWVLTDLTKSVLPVVPMYDKIILSLVGIWMVDYIMKKRDVDG